MKTKRIITLAITLALCTTSVLPMGAIAAQSKNQKEQVDKNTLQCLVKRDKKYDPSYRYGYVNMDWWKNFNDSLLEDYIERAIEHNYDLKMATLTVDEYKQNVKLQFANELPTAGIGFSPAYSKFPMTTDKDWSFAVPAWVNYEADIFLKNRDKTKSVKKLYEASQFDERAAYISIASAVGTTYFNILKINEIIRLQENIVAQRKEIYELMMLSNKEGIVSTADTVKANKAYVYGNSDLIDLKKNRIKMLNQFAVLIGESPENIKDLEFSTLDKISYKGVIPKTVSSSVIDSRPDYLKAEKMIEKAGIDVKVARKEFLPSINLTGLILFNANEFGSLLTTSNSLWALAAGALYPVSFGGKRFTNLKLKKIQYDKILENYYKTNLVAIQEVNDAMVSTKMTDEKLLENKKHLNLEKKDFGYTQLQYNEGTISKLDMLQRKENLYTVNKLVADNQADSYIEYVGFYKAIGAAKI